MLRCLLSQFQGDIYIYIFSRMFSLKSPSSWHLSLCFRFLEPSASIHSLPLALTADGWSQELFVSLDFRQGTQMSCLFLKLNIWALGQHLLSQKHHLSINRICCGGAWWQGLCGSSFPSRPIGHQSARAKGQKPRQKAVYRAVSTNGDSPPGDCFGKTAQLYFRV